MTLKEQVGKALRAARGEVKQKDVAARCGVSTQYIGQIEAGSVNTTLDRLEQYATSLGKKIKMRVEDG